MQFTHQPYNSQFDDTGNYHPVEVNLVSSRQFEQRGAGCFEALIADDTGTKYLVTCLFACALGGADTPYESISGDVVDVLRIDGTNGDGVTGDHLVTPSNLALEDVPISSIVSIGLKLVNQDGAEALAAIIAEQMV